MAEKQNLVSEVVSVVEQALPSQIRRQKRYVYAWPLNKGFLGSLVLNVTRKMGILRIGINPIVGVRSELIEVLVQELAGSHRDRFSVTMSSSLGYLMPEARYLEWVFEAQGTLDYVSEAKKVATAIELYGMPFAEANASLDKIILALEQLQFSSREIAIYRLPVAYLLAERPQLAVRYVNEHLQALGGAQDYAALEYKTFGAALLRKAEEFSASA